MQGHRIFAYITLFLIASMLVMVSTQGFFYLIQPADTRAWLLLIMFAGIYGSVSYGLARRFARKPMRPPTMPMIVVPIMVIPPLIMEMAVENTVLTGSMYAAYVTIIVIGSAAGSWYGMKAGWNHIILALQKKELSRNS